MSKTVTSSQPLRALSLLGIVAVVAALASCSSSAGTSPGPSSNPSNSGSSAAFKVDTSDCTDPAAATKKITGTYTIGYSVALSGPVAGAVTTELNGYKARIAAANAAGGIDGLQIKVIYQDDAFTPDRAKANDTEFIQKDHVNAVTTIGDGQVGAMADDQNAACVPMLYAGSAAAQYSNISQYPWTLNYLPTSNSEASFDIGYIKSKFPNGAKVGIAENTSAAGVGEAQAFQAAAKGSNITVSLVTPDTDPNAAATALAAAKIDVVYVAGVTIDCGPDATAMARIGFTPKLIVNPSNCNSATAYIAAGQAANGSVIPTYIKDPSNPSMAADPGVKEYLSQVHSVDPTNGVTVQGWIQADLTINTLKQAAASPTGLTNVSVIQAARDQTYDSPMMPTGVKWVSTPTHLTGFDAFQAEVWNAADKAFKPIGGLISVTG